MLKPRFSLALVTVSAIAGCSSSRADTGTTPNDEAGAPPAAVAAVPRRYVVGIDVSSSQSAVRRQEGHDLVNALIGRLSYGDQLTLVETYRAQSDRAGQWTDSAPAVRRPGTPTGNEKHRLARFQDRARLIAGGFFTPDPAHPVNSTDILTMLGRAGDYARSAGGRPTTLLIVSDMLNSTGELNMERAGGVPDGRWIASRKAENRLPDLRGVCVVVSGADVASKREAQAREFWRQYFQAAGATFDAGHYRTLIADAAEVSCN